MSHDPQYRLVIQGTKYQVEQADMIFYELLNLDDMVAIDVGEGNGEAWQLALYMQSKPCGDSILKQLSDYMSIDGMSATPEEIPDINWVAKVQKDLAPVRAGRYLVYGHHDKDIGQGLRYGLEIDAGEAFGTAHHGTTLGCLESIDKLLKAFTPHHALDLGTGTGVLALALAQHTKKTVIATDIDPVSVRITKANAVNNKMRPWLKVYQAKGFAHQAFHNASKFDLVIANILADPLRAMAGDISAHVQQGGHLILSGILQTQSRHVLATYQNHGFVFVARIVKNAEREGWTTFHLRKN